MKSLEVKFVIHIQQQARRQWEDGEGSNKLDVSFMTCDWSIGQYITQNDIKFIPYLGSVRFSP